MSLHCWLQLHRTAPNYKCRPQFITSLPISERPFPIHVTDITSIPTTNNTRPTTLLQDTSPAASRRRPTPSPTTQHTHSHTTHTTTSTIPSSNYPTNTPTYPNLNNTTPPRYTPNTFTATHKTPTTMTNTPASPHRPQLQVPPPIHNLPTYIRTPLPYPCYRHHVNSHYQQHQTNNTPTGYLSSGIKAAAYTFPNYPTYP